jgi:neurotransmitter:Na+ symporter, NSS family
VTTGAGERWNGRLGFVLATIGSAVGLGSIWKFPYEVGENGGAGFVLFYLVGLGVIVAPLMLAEFAIGRLGRSDARRSMETVARNHGASSSWGIVGTLGVIASALILSFYSVIGGWALAYVVDTAWAGLPGGGAAAAQARFDALLASPVRMAVYHTIFMVLVAGIVGRGVARGIERASEILMPVLAVLMICLAAYSIVEGDVAATLRYLFAFDASRISARLALEAVGLGFFSIGVGLAVMITYSAYAEPGIDLRGVAVAAILGDTAISFLAGFAVFPIVFANGLDPASGPGLMFVTLPLAFAAMPFGTAVAVAFFLLLFVAALASAISMLEMPVALTRSLGWSRPRGTVVSAVMIWLAGFVSVFSFNLWSEWFPLSSFPVFASATVFDLLDHLTSNLLLPLGGFLIALFAGWVLPAEVAAHALGLGPRGSRLLRWTLRLVVPAAIVAAALVPFVGR